MLNVWSTFQPRRGKSHYAVLYRREVRATLRAVLRSRILVHTLNNAHVIMVGNCKFRREHIVSDSWGRSVEANTR